MQPNQWQQQQFGYTPYGSQQQTGQQRPGGFMASQPTGFPGGAQQQRPMATGMPMQQTGMPGGMGGMGGGMGGMSGGMGGGMGSNMTGMPGMTGMTGSSAGGAGNYSFLNAPPAPGSFGQQRGSGQAGMMSQPTGFGGGSGMMSQPTGMMSQPTGMGGMMSQPTGMGGGMMSQPTGMGGLRAQPTGMHDPRLTTMVQSFMPSNMSQPFSSSGAPQFNQAQSQPLANTFQSLLNNPGVKTPKVPWQLSRQEKKDYDQIFRAWDTRGDGFISGDMAREVFGQSGLSQDDLMKIWNLSDVDNRGKLNLPEFHVAMGLIYRALNGNEIPDKLPDELVPASMRDIDSTVNFMKDLLKHESNTRSDTSSPVYGSQTPMSAASNKDAKVYKHDDSRAGGYKSSARHLDRKAVRYAGEDSGAEISDLRRQLENASGMLDSKSADTARKTEEDELLEQEVEDIKYRVKRIKEDIDYVSKGRRTTEKDEERRKLEREMLYLMHEKLPEIERRQERRAEEKRMEERAGIRARDKRNESHGRFDSGRDRDHDWLRGSYERDRSRDRDRDYPRRGSQSRDYDRYDRDRDNRDYRDSRDRYDDRDRRDDRDRSRDRYERRGSTSARDDSRDRRDRDRDHYDDRDRDRNGRSGAASAPRAPSPKKAEAAPAPAAKKEPAKPATKSLASMTPEERKAYLKEQAQRKIQERMRALGVETPNEPAVDVGVEDRLAQEKKEAEERAKAADAEQQKREEARAARIASARGEAPAAPSAPKESAAKPPAPPPPKTTPKKGPPAPPTPRHKAAPPAPTPRSAPSAPKPPPSPSKPAAPAEDPEEVELRAQEEARQKAIQERRERLKRLQEEEEEERRKEEEIMAARKARSAPAPAPETSTSAAAPAAPPASEAPKSPSFNPFHRQQTGGAAARSPTAPSFNPFFRPPPVEDPSASTRAPPAERAPEPAAAAAPPPPPPPPPPAAPTPPPAAATQSFAPPPRNNSARPPDDDWEDAREKEIDESDSSDDEYAKSRASRGALASALFGNIMGGGGSRPGTASPPPAPAPPKAPPAALANLGGGNPSGGMSALLSSIQGGARLRKAETNDRSGPSAGGHVIGDAAPPAHINAAPAAPPSPPPQHAAPRAEEEFVPRHDNRSSVDWYSGIAAESPHPAATHAEHALEPTREEEERDAEPPVDQMAAASVSDGPSLDDVDLSRTLHVRTLFDYVSTFDGDLPFRENTVLEAHPAKDPGGPWWYGTLPDGSAGWFPSSYVQESVVKPCRALYDYTAQSNDELSFGEGDPLPVVDQEDPDWWKVERDGAILLVPAAYVEVIGSRSGGELTQKQQQQQSNDAHTAAPAAGPSQESHGRSQHSSGDAQATATNPIPNAQASNVVEAPTPVPVVAFPMPRTSASPSPSPSPRQIPSLTGVTFSIPKPSASPSPTPSPRQTPSPGRIVTSPHVMVNTIAPSPGGATPGGVTPHDTHRRPAPPPPSTQERSTNRDSLMIPHDATDASSWSSSSSRRSRGASVSQYSVQEDDEGYASSDSDSVLFWSSDDDDEGDEEGQDSHSKEERRRREAERQKVLEAAGLKIRRPSSASSMGRRNAVRRRRAPPAPPTKAKTNGDVEAPHETEHATPPPAPPIEIHDAYARYEAFLAESKARPGAPPAPAPAPASATPTTPTLPAPGHAPAPSGSGATSTRSSRPASFILSELSPSQTTFKEAASTRLTGLLSRIGVGNNTANDSSANKPKISGPMISGPMNAAPMSSPASAEDKASATTAATTPDTSDFGKTWSSLVDPSVLATMGDRERKRQEAIFELIATEGTYVRDMQLVVGVFYARVMELLDDKALRVIFANVEDILMFNTFFLSSLEDRQKSCRLYIDTIGDILAEHCQNLEVYMPYCVNQDTARKLLVQLRAENPQLEAALRDVRENNPDVRGLDLSSFLLQPMQRITRYPLLLHQIAHYTDEDQDLGSVQSALSMAERTVARINEEVREAESVERLRALSNDLWVGGEGHIDLTAPTALQGPRKLLKEGAVTKAKSGRRLWLVLCTDVLILIEGTNLYRMPIPLHDLGLQQGRDDVSFAVSVRVPRHEEVRLRAPSNRERVEWVSLITRARKDCEAARRASVKNANVYTSPRAQGYSHRRQISDTTGTARAHRRQSSDTMGSNSYATRRQSSDTLGSLGYAPRPSTESYASAGGGAYPSGGRRRPSSVASAASLGYNDAMLGLSPPTQRKPRPLSISTAGSGEILDYAGHSRSMHDHQF